jgi:protein arginine kinase activator
MKCDICGDREAVVFVHQSSRGTKTELRLCADCAKSRGIDRLDGDVSASLSKLLSAVSPGREGAAQRDEGRRCPRCGSPVADIRKRGLASCASCWSVLAETASASFRPHAGRLPLRVAARRAAAEDLAKLKVLLAAAVKAEDYETAARCRDRIRELGGDAAHA